MNKTAGSKDIWIVAIFILVLPLYVFLVYTYIRYRALPSQSQDIETYVSALPDIQPDPVYQFQNPVNQPPSYNLKWYPPDDWEITGYVIQNDLLTTGRISIKVPDEKSGKSETLVAELDPSGHTLLSMFLNNGKIENEMLWKARTIEEISNAIKTGGQIVVYVPYNQNQAAQIEERLHTDGFALVSPIKKMIVGSYE